MEKYNELDVIELTKDRHDLGLTKGQRGTVLLVHNDDDYEVEFSNQIGIPVYLGEMSVDNFKKAL